MLTIVVQWWVPQQSNPPQSDAHMLWMQCGRRALTTSNAQCVCAVLGQLNNLLTTALYPQLHAKLEVSRGFKSDMQVNARTYAKLSQAGFTSLCDLKGMLLHRHQTKRTQTPLVVLWTLRCIIASGHSNLGS